ncbi:hypothetical protein [Mycolicibacterium baixiangningiae]|uniref:hypothetical protein n=1 Tax=Mycolicibacterium baixiangningiae TaxID=2761578 RepID=UPI0018D1B183|nr:hypothetical protein [Mycolicibacterium baixiangningiae]
MTDTPGYGDNSGETDSEHPEAPTQEECKEFFRRVVSELAHAQTIANDPVSPISADNEFMLEFGTTMHELAALRLFNSLDHLQLTALSLGTSASAIFSQYSLVRSALAAASTAHWLLSGNAAQRRMRALRLAYDDLCEETKFANSITEEPARIDAANADAVKNAHAVIKTSPTRLDAMYDAYCSLAQAEGENVHKRGGFGFQETNVIDEVSQMMQKTNRIAHKKELLLQYRVMSGFVHNCRWAIRSGVHMKLIEADEYGTAMQITGNPGNVYRGARTAFVVAMLAKARLSELAAKP